MTRPQERSADAHFVVETMARREVDAGVQRLPSACADSVIDGVTAEAFAERLVAADHARLLGEDGIEGHAATDEIAPVAVPQAAG